MSKYLLSNALILFALIVTGCGSRDANISPGESGKTISGATPEWDVLDWPQWRGKYGNGVADSNSAPTNWSDEENITWSTVIPGRGHASPVVVGGVVYLATAMETAQEQWVVAFDAGNGELLWKTKLHEGNFPDTPKMHIKSTHANSTVACDGERVFAVFMNDDKVHASALSLKGEIEWQTTLGSFDSQFGYAPSPVIYKSALIVPADHKGGGFIAAVDRESGDIVWRTARPKESSYSSALIAKVDGKDQLVICGCRQVTSYDPMTGKQNWKCAATTSGTCGTVVADEKNIYASGGFPGEQTARIKGDGSAEIVWSNTTRLYEPSLVLTNGLLFGITDEGIAHCWDAESGVEKWKSRLAGNFSASPIVVGDMVYVSNDVGLTFIFRATGDGYEEVARNQLGKGAYGSMAISGESLFIRAVHRGDGKRTERLHRIN